MEHRKNVRVLAACLIAGIAYFAVAFLDGRSQEANRDAQLAGWDARVAGLAAIHLDGLSLPESLPLPDGLDADERAAQLKQTYSTLVARVNATTAERPLPPSWNGDPADVDPNMVNMALLEYTIKANPELVSSSETWLAAVRARISAIRLECTRCPCVRFGSPVESTDQLADSLEREANRYAATHDGPTRISLGAMLADHTRAAEARLANARPMPVINGEAKGTLPAAGTLIRFCEQRLALPATQTFYSDSKNASCAFKLTTRAGGAHVYARLVQRGRDAWRGFVRAGDSIRVELPYGDYTLRYAMGRNWFGSSFLFGPESTFSEAGDVVDLRYGYETTIELIPQAGGNLSERSIDANSF